MRHTRIVLSLLLLTCILPLFASEIEDVGYIAYLYRMGETRTAMLKIDQFLQDFPDSQFRPDVLFLRAGVDLTEGRYERSRDTYGELLGAHSDPAMRAEAALGHAQANYFLGDDAAAEAELREFTRTNPEHPLNAKAWYFIGKIQQDRGDHEDALDSFDAAARYGDDPSLRVVRVHALAEMGRYEAAERQVMELFDRGETTAGEEALLLYHDVNLRRGRAARALEFELDRIPPASLWYADYIELLAQANYELGYYDEAVRRVDRMDIPSEEALYVKALSLLALQRFDDASVIFRQLYESAKDQDIAVNSYFYLARLTARKDAKTGNDMLEGFLVQHPDHPQAGAAAYQLAMNHFDAGEYGKASSRFEQAASLPLEDANLEKARYLDGEALFLAGSRQQAETAYSDYLNAYPQGRFTDEALFKLGLIHFETKRYDGAEDRFKRLVEEFTQSPKVGMAQFYLGEIAFFGGRYDFALEHYNLSLQGETDEGYAWERIARIHFQNNDYNAAESALANIPDNDRYGYDKNLLAGDVAFAQKDYLKALTAYQAAVAAAETTQQSEAVKSRLAWTYYQRGDYDRSAQIYSELSSASSSPETFLMLAAQAAFSADDYLTAIQYYREYVQKHPNAAEYNKAVLGLADCYYNLGSYDKAVDYYRPLVRDDVPDEILENALNGLVWSARQSEEIDLGQEIEKLMGHSQSQKLAPRLLHRKAEYLYEQKRYDEAVVECNRINSQYSGYAKRLDVYRLLAQCFRAQGKNPLAESVYQQMYEISGGDAEVLFDWAQVKLAMQDTLGAIEKMAQAANNTHSSRVWLALLQTQLAVGDDNFLDRYGEFTRFADDRETAEAQLLWVAWQVKQQQYGLVDPVLNTLGQSQWKDIRAQAQLWTGRVLYERKEYELAVAELLRVRYLYPEAVNAQMQAEFYACLAWLDMGETEKARERFTVIREGLSPGQVRAIESRLGGVE